MWSGSCGPGEVATNRRGVDGSRQMRVSCNPLNLFKSASAITAVIPERAERMKFPPADLNIRLCSSIGRAPACHAGGSGIETHQSRHLLARGGMRPVPR